MWQAFTYTLAGLGSGVYTEDMWCGYKITRLMLEHLLFKKLHNRNVVTLNVLPSTIPTPLHANFPLLEAMLQVVSDSLFMSSVAFAFTASTVSNLVPFNADLIFGNKKSHMGLGQVSTVDVPTLWSCASKELLGTVMLRIDTQTGYGKRHWCLYRKRAQRDVVAGSGY